MRLNPNCFMITITPPTTKGASPETLIYATFFYRDRRAYSTFLKGEQANRLFEAYGRAGWKPYATSESITLVWEEE